MLTMDTPTSQAQTNRPALKLEDCLSQLATGTFAYGQLAAFSDLNRSQLAQVEAVWATLEPDIRRKVVASAVDLAEESVEYQFSRLLRLAMADAEADIRQTAIRGLWEDDSRSLLDDLIGVIRDDPSADVRAVAVEHVGNAVASLDSSSDASLRERIADVLLAIGGDEGESTLVRRRAIESLGGLEQDEESRDIIQDAWEFGDQALEAAALVAMGRSFESRWLPVVRQALGSDDAELRFEAARALGTLGTSDDVPGLAAATLDDDGDVRLAAIGALGEIGGPGAVRVLRNLADQLDESEREPIEDALDAALLAGDPMRMPT
jgi:HEAT repeat protein